jgi:hypothetical protein
MPDRPQLATELPDGTPLRPLTSRRDGRITHVVVDLPPPTPDVIAAQRDAAQQNALVRSGAMKSSPA